MSAPPDRPVAGLAVMLGGVVMTTIVDAATKHLVSAYPVGQVMALRGILVLLFALPLVVHAGGLASLRTGRPVGHALRALAGIGSTLGFYIALRELPLATAVAISLSGPIFMTALSVPLLRERVGIWRWSAVLAGFGGVLIITDPFGDAGISAGMAWALFCALSFALSMIAVRWMAATESSLTLLFYVNVGMLVAGLAQVPFAHAAMTGPDMALMAALGAGMLIGQFMTITAFRLAPVSLVSPLYYLGIVLAAAIGWLLWHEVVPVNVWIGSAVIIGSGLTISWR